MQQKEQTYRMNVQAHDYNVIGEDDIEHHLECEEENH